VKALIALSLLGLVVLTGCGKPAATPKPDQKLRQELFFKCLASVPAGPVETKYNDWSEVVEACGEEARLLSYPPEAF
jgi:hypothetical protein